MLPVGQAPAPPPAAQPAPPIDYDEGGGIGLLPILIGLAALAGLLWLLLHNDDEDEVVSP
ncbi:MAG TPA: hypothetical protein VGX37_02470 [Allosphingosinicella sp.]|nr:hypothetical protein [Allosphingosinicella sp.]